MTSFTLTEAERATLNDAMAIIQSRTVTGASWQIFPANYEGRQRLSVSYFTGNPRIMHGWDNWEGKTFADMVQEGLNIEAATPSAEELRARKVAELRAELAQLEGQAA